MDKGKVSKKEAISLDEFQKEFKKIGNRMKQLRKESGYTSAEKFSNEFGFDRKTYGTWENGKPMSMQSIIRVIQSHGISMADFFKGL